MKTNFWKSIALAGVLLVGIATVAGAAAPTWERIPIDHGNSEGCSVVDVNNDGALDIVCLPNWFRAPYWDKRPIAIALQRSKTESALAGEGLPVILRSGEFFMNFGQIAMDVNDDGWTDIVSAGWFDKDIFWYQNPGFSKKNPKKYNMSDEYNLWKKRLVGTPPQLSGGPESIFPADIDGDGRTDIISNQRPIGWYRIEKIENGEPVFNRYPIDERGTKLEEWQHGLGYGDLNGDGRNDVLTNDGWFEAPANPRTEKWTAHSDFFLHDASIPMIIADFDGDGDNDFAYGHGHNFGVFWVEQTKETGKARWKQHVIDKSWSQCHSMVWIDIDADGKNELVTGKRLRGHNGDDPGAYDPLGVYYYEVPADPTQAWPKEVITHGEHVGAGMQVTVVDIDKDGDLDVVCPGKSGLYLMRNKTK